MRTNKISIRLIFSLAVVSLFAGLNFAQNPAKILDQTVAKLNAATGISCKFRVEGSGNTLNGLFKSEGRKFYLETQAGKTWYDGKNMWTSNPRSKEITLVNPTTGEVNEVNPFSYLNSYRASYVVGFSKRKDVDRYLVVLNPKQSGGDIKAVEVAVNKKTRLPERFIIRNNKDQITTIYVDALSTTVRQSKETFTCPSSSMADYELIDLR